MGRLSLTELAYLLLAHREPTPGERRLLDAVLVSLADHGLTPSALAARLTYTGAPEAIQGAIAAGLLGAGSVFLGPTGDTAQFLYESIRDRGEEGLDDDALRRIAYRAVDALVASGARVPGLGHPIHRDEDPRVPACTNSPRPKDFSGHTCACCDSWPRLTPRSAAVDS